MTRLRTHSAEELGSPGQEGLQGLCLCHSHRPVSTRGRKTSLAGCPPFGHRHQPGPEVTSVADALRWGSLFPAVQGPQVSTDWPFVSLCRGEAAGSGGLRQALHSPGLPGAARGHRAQGRGGHRRRERYVQGEGGAPELLPS